MRLALMLPLVVFLILIVTLTWRLIAVNEGGAPNLLPSMLVNRPVPKFILPALPGREQPLRDEDLNGEVSLVNIFGSWCMACIAEHPFLMSLKDSGAVPVHGINWRDDPEKGAAWLRRYGDPYNLVGVDLDSRVAIDLGVSGAPETFLIDGGGVIRFKHIGPITSKVWQEILAPLVKQLQSETL